MLNAFERKSIFIWNVPEILSGNADSIAQWLKAHGFSSVMPKCADGPYVFYPSRPAFPNWVSSQFKFGRPNVDRAFVDTMHAHGIAVIGWGFNYGRNPDGEGRVAAQQCDALGLDGWAFDVEGEFENRSSAIGDAGKVVGTFNKTIIRKVPTAYCGWAEFYSPTGSQWHNVALAKFWMGFADYGMPMYYWDSYGGDGKPINTPPSTVERELKAVLAQWQRLTTKPIIPAGRAYTGDGGFATPETVLAFGELARRLCKGVTYWVLDHAIKMPAVADALAETPAFPAAEEPIPPVPTHPDPPPTPGTIEDRVAKLETRVSTVENKLDQIEGD